jgi:16S rRNA (cytidine1402-2'-O)-methyltransferase
LIAAAIDHKIVVTPIPGVTAATAAMSVSGLPTDSFTFVGFAPKKKGKRIRFLKALGTRSESLLFYESPKRIISLMQDIIVCMGDRYAILAREMTKLHEEFIRGTVSQILNVIRSRSTVKGECTLLVAGRHQLDEMDIRSVRATLESALENETGSLSEIARHIAQEYGLPKKTVYDLALEIRGRRTEVGGQKSEDRRLRTED